MLVSSIGYFDVSKAPKIEKSNKPISSEINNTKTFGHDDMLKYGRNECKSIIKKIRNIFAQETSLKNRSLSLIG